MISVDTGSVVLHRVCRAALLHWSDAPGTYLPQCRVTSRGERQRTKVKYYSVSVELLTVF